MYRPHTLSRQRARLSRQYFAPTGHRFVHIEPLEDRTLLTAYVVNTDADVVGADGVISLREAIEAANTNAAVGDAPAGMADGDSITFAAAVDGMPIVLALGQLEITEDLSINGQNLDITIDADGASRVFNITTSEVVRLANLTLTGGLVANFGGAMLVAAGGTTNLRHMTITENTASGAGGGGIFVDASTVNISHSLIADNHADGTGGSGGGIHVGPTGVLNVYHSRILDNTASGDAAINGGGGIYNNVGTVSVNLSSIRGNSADGDSGSGGGIFSNAGEVSLVASHVEDNSANRAGGGLEVVASEVTIALSALAENTAGPVGSAAPGNGGGLHVTGADSAVRILASRIHGNTAASEGGGLWNDAGSTMHIFASAITGNSALGIDPGNGGGGIFNNGGVLDVVFSTISRNTAAGDGGGLFLGDGGDVNISFSQVSHNEAGGNGGGIFNNAELRVLLSSVSRNTAASDGGGIYTDALGVTDLVFALLFGNSPNNLAGPGAVI